MSDILSNVILTKIQNPNCKFIIFGLEYCPFTKFSKDICKNNNLKYKFYPIDKYKNIFLESLNKLDKQLIINSNHNTFPIIFYDQKFIGGSTDLKYFIDNVKLKL